jgi:hypothetical protein
MNSQAQLGIELIKHKGNKELSDTNYFLIVYNGI